MRRAERVVHVGVRELGEPAREPDVVGLLPGIEPEVLEQHHVTGLDVPAHGLGPVADDLVQRHHVCLEELAEPVGDGPEAQVVPRLAVRPPEVRGDHGAAPRSRSSRSVGTVERIRRSSAPAAVERR